MNKREVPANEKALFLVSGRKREREGTAARTVEQIDGTVGDAPSARDVLGPDC